MSGTKSSDVNYDRRGDLILGIRSSREDLLRRMKFLTNEVQALCNKIDSTQLNNKHLISALGRYIESLNGSIAEISEKEEILNRFTVRTGASLTELEKDQLMLGDEYNFNARVTNDTNSGVNPFFS